MGEPARIRQCDTGFHRRVTYTFFDWVSSESDSIPISDGKESRVSAKGWGIFFPTVLFFLSACSSATQPPLTTSGNVSLLRSNSAQEAVLHSFAGGDKDGSTPISSLLRIGNLFYGTTGGGGRYGHGTVFSMTPAGTGFTVLYSFKGQKDGSGSPAGLVNVAGKLYGTTSNGGAAGKGTVFSITPSGTFATLYSFKGGKTDGASPMAALKDLNGTLYGTTASGGQAGSGGGACLDCGTVFSISTSGQEKVLYFFGSKADDGIGPQSPLVAIGRKLYGTTTNGGRGGVTGDGTIFSVTTGGKEAILHGFDYHSDGSCGANCYLTPIGGMLYGTAYSGGKDHVGSVFSITTAGAFKTLFSASRSGTTGGNPDAALTNSGGTLYGTMSAGPIGKDGTVFSIVPGSALQIIYAFTGGDDGGKPQSKLNFVNGVLYGTTAKGGSAKLGTIYSITGF